ncbi:unnamed protein product [Heterobilharzia americana]|nr:unnamed protein product [Heterobilharzia americana]
MKTLKKKRGFVAPESAPDSNKVKNFFSRVGSGLRSAFHKPHQHSVPVSNRDVSNHCYSSDDLRTSKELKVSTASATTDGLSLSKTIVFPLLFIYWMIHIILAHGHHIAVKVCRRFIMLPLFDHTQQLSFDSILKKKINKLYDSFFAGLISLQHRLAVSRPRNRRPPTKATNHQSENIDDNFVCFFSPSSSSTNVPINSFISTPNPQLDLIKEEGEVVVVVEEEEEINKTSDRATSPSSFDVDLTSFSSIINTEETIHDSQNSSQFNSPISRISLRGSTKSFCKSDSLKRESQPSLQPDYTTGWDHDTPTPYKPPKKGIGFERIKLNSFIESDRIITPLSHNHEAVTGGGQNIRPHSMFIASSVKGETTQNSVKLKPVNILNDLDDKQQQQQQHDESLSFTSSESIPSIVFIPCKSSVEKVSRDCNEAKEDINDSGWPIVKKSISIDPEESTNKYSSSSLVQPMPILRKHAENAKAKSTSSENRVSRVLDLVKAFEASNY